MHGNARAAALPMRTGIFLAREFFSKWNLEKRICI